MFVFCLKLFSESMRKSVKNQSLTPLALPHHVNCRMLPVHLCQTPKLDLELGAGSLALWRVVNHYVICQPSLDV
jgi:hypothetical protein